MRRTLLALVLAALAATAAIGCGPSTGYDDGCLPYAIPGAGVATRAPAVLA